MNLSRREFLLLAGAALSGGCHSVERGGGAVVETQARVVDTGPATNYASDGVYSGFRDAGFFVVRKGEQLFAVSSICTHKKCKLAAEPDRSFYCKCHGSTFNPDGKVTRGPARRNLPTFPLAKDERQHLLVTLSNP